MTNVKLIALMGKPKYLQEGLSHCLFIHYKPHIDWTGIEPRVFIVRGPVTDCLSHDMALS
jgi:hypothetical protein